MLDMNNRREKRVEFPRYGNGAQVHEAIISTLHSFKCISPLPFNSLIMHTSACNDTASPWTRCGCCSMYMGTSAFSPSQSDLTFEGSPYSITACWKRLRYSLFQP